MRAARNQPCPCGSGRKYKHCCEATDSAVGALFRLSYHDLKRGPSTRQRVEQIRAQPWEAGVIPLPQLRQGSSAGEPGMVVVVGGGLLLYLEALDRTPSEADLGAVLLERAIRMTARDLSGLPPEVRVRDVSTAERLRAMPSLAEVPITDSADLSALDEFARGAAEQWAGPSASPQSLSLPAAFSPETWSGWGFQSAFVAELFRAAAAYWRAAPWKSVDNLQSFSARMPSGSTWTASVLGDGGEEFGLSLFRKPEDFLRILEAEDPIEGAGGLSGLVLSLLFETRSNLPPPMQKEILAKGWQVAARDAHPTLMAINPAQSDDLSAGAEELVQLLWSVPRFVARHRELLETDGDPAAPVTWTDPKTGVELTYSGHAADEGEGLLWPPPAKLEPALPSGPGADPAAALGGEGLDPEALLDRELAVVRRFEQHLKHSRRSDAARKRDIENATWLIECLTGYVGIPLASCTERDLRVFLYDWFPRKVRTIQKRALALPASLTRFVEYLAEHEELEFPWAEPILSDQGAFEAGYMSFPGGFWWDEAVQDWQGELYQDLDARVLTPDFAMAGEREWGETMGLMEYSLRRELERRWLLWRDELIAAGETEPEVVRRMLIARQRQWETAPHSGHGGRAPVDLVEEERGKKRG